MNLPAAVHAPIRPVFCVVDHAHRDLEVARAVVTGAFTVAGRTVTVGRQPDWTSDPFPSDREWRVDWVKFYFGLDLAHAWQVTGNRLYADGWERLVTSYLSQVPAGADATEVIARRIQNWIYTWNRFAAGGEAPFTSNFAIRLGDYLWDEVVAVEQRLSAERNHRTLELYALLVAATACPDRDPGGRLQREAFAALSDNLLADVRPDGVHRESSTHYHCIALRSWLGALAIARQRGLTPERRFIDRLAAACDFAACVHRPDGRIPACSDADAESYLDVVGLAGELFARDDWQWIATRGQCGVPPTSLDHGFTTGGYYLQRNGWEAGSGYLVFDCGPLGDGGHGHYDLLNVDVCASGQPIISDPGRYTYSEAGERNWRHWFKGTRAHNTVTVDGLDQTAYDRRKPKGVVATGRLVAHLSAPSLSLVAGEARSGQYDAVHTRAVLFVGREYWVVIDRLWAPTPHRYQLRWHLSPEASTRVELTDGGTGVDATGVALAFSPSRRVVLEDDWYAPVYGVRQPATTVMVESQAYTTTFVTAIVPAANSRRDSRGHGAVRVGFLSRGDRPADLAVLEVSGVGPAGNGRDIITWSADAHFFELAHFKGVARAAWLRRDGDDRTLAFSALDATVASWSNGGHHTTVDMPASRRGWLEYVDGRLVTGPHVEARR